MERDKLLGTMDAKVWTDEFMATKARLGDEEFDHAMMLAWFANAIMAGFDEATRCAQRALDAEKREVWHKENYIGLLHHDNAALTAQLATLQAQLRQVEGERAKWEDIAGLRFAGDHKFVKEMELLKVENTTLRQLVEAFVQHFDSDFENPGLELYGRVNGGLAKARATLAAKDAPLTDDQLRSG